MVRSEGSSPGRQGFKMAVTAEPKRPAPSAAASWSTSGWSWPASACAPGDATPCCDPRCTGREAPADRSGMMCSGEQEVLLWPLQPS
ncbi:MAG: hypothetical protein WKG07_09555 [Hymenobacter sp.]